MKRIALALSLAACASPAASPGVVPAALSHSIHRAQGSIPIAHVIVIVQENRTVDNLFQFFPGADVASSGPVEGSGSIPLKAVSLKVDYDIKHTHAAWQNAYDGGAMDGFNREGCIKNCPVDGAYRYVPQKQVQPYYTIGEEYGFANYMFEGNQGPSLPAHQYLVSGASSIATGSPWSVEDNPAGGNGGCDSPANTTEKTIDVAYGQQGTPVFPCFNRTSIFTLLDAAGISWKYYQATTGAGLFNAVDALQPYCPYTPCSSNPEYAANVVTPPAQVLTDIAGGNLASVVFVTPTAQSSDHPGDNDGSGPSWVASIVNAVGESQYWNSTAIFITWDDWGGWYDHVQPTIYNSYENGFRVPLLVVSPYAKTAYVSPVHHEPGSILHFIEEVYGLPSLGTTDARADDLSDFFQFGQKMRSFKRITAPHGASYFLHLPARALSELDD